MKPFLSIIILNFNRKADCLDLLNSLEKQTYKDFEVILVDNRSTDGSVEAVRKRFPKVKVVALTKNIGRAGQNEGVKIASGKILVFLDADILLPNNFLENVASKFRKKQVDAVSFQMLHPTDPTRHWKPNYFAQGDKKTGFESTFGGGMWAVKRKIFEDVGGFNPDFFVYVDEWEYLLRLWNKGYKVKYFPDVVGFHKESPYSYRSVMKGYHVIINHAQLYALFLPVKHWPRFLSHHSTVATKTLVKGEANRWYVIKGLVLTLFYFLKALPQRQVLKPEALEKFLRFYFPKKGDVVVEKLGWFREIQSKNLK